MSRSTAPALRGTLLRMVLRLWNPVMRRLLESRAHWPLSRWFAVLVWSGRKTGRHYSTPISYLREGTTVHITTGDIWWRNLIGGAPVAMCIAGRWYQANAVAVTDADESRAEHERLFREHPWFGVLAGIPRTQKGPDPAAVARAVAAGRVLIRVDLRG